MKTLTLKSGFYQTVTANDVPYYDEWPLGMDDPVPLISSDHWPVQGINYPSKIEIYPNQIQIPHPNLVLNSNPNPNSNPTPISNCNAGCAIVGFRSHSNQWIDCIEWLETEF